MNAVCLSPATPCPPGITPPPGACDSHVHVVGPFDRYPLAAVRPYTPPPVPVDALERYLDTMGLDRVVIAQVAAHGNDLRVTLDALARLGDRARGVAILDPSVPDDELARLHAAGMRGVRLSSAYRPDLAITESALLGWSDRIGPMGWHIATMPVSIDDLQVMRRVADRGTIPLVVDHLGSHAWNRAGDLGQPGFRALLDLLSTGHVYVKLSGMYRSSAEASRWTDLRPFAAALVDANPARMLWASDWPHVGMTDPTRMPQSGDLLDWLDTLGLDEEALRATLVSNPARLYGFDGKI